MVGVRPGALSCSGPNSGSPVAATPGQAAVLVLFSMIRLPDPCLLIERPPALHSLGPLKFKPSLVTPLSATIVLRRVNDAGGAGGGESGLIGAS